MFDGRVSAARSAGRTDAYCEPARDRHHRHQRSCKSSRRLDAPVPALIESLEEEIMPILKQGSSGSDVKNLQQKLKDLGFDPKGVDGNFGPGTKAAVITFQISKGLHADGIAGPQT